MLSVLSTGLVHRTQPDSGASWIILEVRCPALHRGCAWRAVQLADGRGLITLRGDRRGRGCLWAEELRWLKRRDSTRIYT